MMGVRWNEVREIVSDATFMEEPRKGEYLDWVRHKLLQCPQKDGTSAQTVCGDVHWRLTAENVARGDEVRCSECFKLELAKERMEPLMITDFEEDE